MRAVLIATATMLALSATCASAADFTFSFTGNTSFPGATRGEIFGLSEGTSTPTSVEVFSSTSPAGTYPVIFTTANSTFNGAFTVSQGLITGARFQADNATSGLSVGLNNQNKTNFFGRPNSLDPTDAVSNNNGFSGATYAAAAPSVSAAPEPGSWLLMLGGVGVIGAMMRVARARRREDDLKSLATA